MKSNLLIPLLLTSAFLLTPGSGEVVPGDDREAVLKTLGEPTGTIGSDNFQILHFARGEVHLRDGIVERTELVSEEEAEAKRIEREERREARRLARERERQERIEQGETLRDQKLTDESFAERPPRERLAFWRTFRRHYPEVDVSFQLEVARAAVEEVERIRREEERREERLLAMERRVREAEARAAEAEASARSAQEELRRAQYRPQVIYTTPLHPIHPPHKKPDEDSPEPRDRVVDRKREVRGEPEREPTAFERAREFRHERSQQRSELRRHTSGTPENRPVDSGRKVRGAPQRAPSAFDRAREFRQQRIQQRSELRRSSS